jgi:hypothetical protein
VAKSRLALKSIDEESSMRNRTISIPLDPHTAEAYVAIRAEEKAKIQKL